MSNRIDDILSRQRAFFHSGQTLDVAFRIAQLKKLYAAVQKYQEQINAALTADLGKSSFEGFMCESGLVLTEISHMIRHVRRFAREKTVYTPLAFLVHAGSEEVFIEFFHEVELTGKVHHRTGFSLLVDHEE